LTDLAQIYHTCRDLAIFNWRKREFLSLAWRFSPAIIALVSGAHEAGKNPELRSEGIAGLQDLERRKNLRKMYR